VIEKNRKSLEVQIADLHTRLDQAEANALKGGRKVIQKLEQRVSCSCFQTVYSLLKLNSDE
jgi:hypothetical protein